MGYSIFGNAHTGPLYGCLPSADIGQVVYLTRTSDHRISPRDSGWPLPHQLLRYAHVPGLGQHLGRVRVEGL